MGHSLKGEGVSAELAQQCIFNGSRANMKEYFRFSFCDYRKNYFILVPPFLKKKQKSGVEVLTMKIIGANLCYNIISFGSPQDNMHVNINDVEVFQAQHRETNECRTTYSLLL